MSFKTDFYLSLLRPMEGQQADRPETEPDETTTTEPPMHPHRSQPSNPEQQSLFTTEEVP